MSSGLALRVKISRSPGCFAASASTSESGERRIARQLRREDAYAGRQIGADGLQLLPDLVARCRPERHHDLGARGPDQADQCDGSSIQLVQQVMPAASDPSMTV